MSSNPIEMIENLIGDYMRKLKVLGLSVGIILNGKSIYAGGFGARNLEHNLPMTEDTLFGIASMSKSFCALAIMQLVEQGKVDLNAPVGNYINFKLGIEEKPITVHHLLCHTSGLPELQAGSAARAKENFIPMSSDKDFLLFVNRAKEELFANPGELFMYNNDMYICLGLIVEKVSGVKFEEYVRKNILNPLGMERSTYLNQKFLNDNNVVTGYVISNDGKSTKEYDLKRSHITYACGGLYSSVNELQKYLICLMNEGMVDGKQIVKNSSLGKMWTSYITPPSIYGKGYGYGFYIDSDFFGYQHIAHGGNIQPSGGYFGMIPEKNMAVIVGQIPSPTILPKTLVRGILATLLGKNINEAVPIIATLEKIERLLGNYSSYGRTHLKLELEGGTFLKATIKPSGGGRPTVLPVIVKDLDNLKFYAPTAYPGMNIDIQGKINSKTGKIIVQADRYVFHKID